MADMISLDEIKNFCRIDDDLDGYSEPELLAMRDAAIDQGEHLTGRDWRKKWTPETFPPSLKMWTLNRVASMFDTRGDVVDVKVTKTPRTHVDALLDRWVVYGCRRR